MISLKKSRFEDNFSRFQLNKRGAINFISFTILISDEEFINELQDNKNADVFEFN